MSNYHTKECYHKNVIFYVSENMPKNNLIKITQLTNTFQMLKNSNKRQQKTILSINNKILELP